MAKRLAPLLVVMLSGCSSVAINDYCAIANPIYVSKNDGFTDLTARQILDHNETGEKVCEWTPSN